MNRATCRQSGFAAIAAIILMTVLAAMGAFMLTFSNTQQLTSAQDIQSTRAYWAARAGLEWALSAVVLNSSACPSSPPTTVDTGATFTLTIGCTRSTYLEGATTVVVFSIQSVAGRGTPGSIGYVERSLSASYELP